MRGWDFCSTTPKWNSAGVKLVVCLGNLFVCLGVCLGNDDYKMKNREGSVDKMCAQLW